MSLEQSHAKGSTDLGEVSQLVPQANSRVTVALPNVAGHSAEFAQASASREGHVATLSAKAMAWAAIDVMPSPGLLAETWKAFREKE